jgi:class 3 adenylate cyclase
MAKLSARERAGLPASAFAYIDADGKRRLPIHDEAHVRNALARFDRVVFEDDAARDRARKRLLNAAKKYGILPVGFIDGQVRMERRQAKALDVSKLPVGEVTFLLTDIEDSTALLRHLGDGYGDLLTDVRDLVRNAVLTSGGKEVDARADEFFAAFDRAGKAVEAAVAIQLAMVGKAWPDDLECRLRAGIHTGRPTLTETGYIGLSVHTAARVCSAANGGQIVLSGDTKDALEGSSPTGVRLKSLGKHRLPGLTRAEALYQVVADGLGTKFPPLRRQAEPSPKAKPARSSR